MLTNEKSFPKRYLAKHFQAGTCKYDEKIIFVDNSAINEANKSFEGKPVYVDHQDVDLDNLKETADGYVVRSFFNPLDGWYWLEFIAVSDELNEKINAGWSVSNAYAVLETGNAGSWHNIAYDYEVLRLEFNHLAIVSNPRYEQSCIKSPEDFKKYNEALEIKQNELRNSLDIKKNNNGGLIMNLFKKKQEVVAIDADVFITLENGNEERLVDVIKFVNEKAKEEEENKKKNETEEEKKYAEDGDMVKVGKNEVSVKELKSAYKNFKKNEEEKEKEKEEAENKKKNELEEEEKKKEEENKKKNAEEEKKKEDEENKNSVHFNSLKDSVSKGEVLNNSIQYKTKAQLLEEGRKRY